MKRQYCIHSLLTILYCTISLSAMQEKSLITRQNIDDPNDIIIKLEKVKAPGKILTIIHTTHRTTQEQSWCGYLTLLLSNRYIAYYKYDPDTARQKWNKLNNQIA